MVNQEVNPPLKTGARFFYGYIIVVVVFILQMVMYGPRISFGVFFKPMMSDFNWTRALISGAASVSTIAQGLSGIFMGGLNDRLGPRAVMTICGLILGLGYLLMSRISAAWQLYLFYVVIVGISMGGFYAPQFSTVARWFVKRRGFMTGIIVAGGGAGGLIVPPVANWLISTYGWRQAYIIMGIVVLAIVILAAQFLKRDPAQMGQLPFGDDRRQERELPLVPEGLSLKEATGTRQYWMLEFMLFCFGFSLVTLTVHIVPHATDLGISDVTAANILASSGGAILASSILLGVVADRIGNRRTFIICYVLLSTAMCCLLVAREVWLLYLSAIVVGFANGGIATLQSTVVAELFGMRSHGLILGSCNFCVIIGSAIGPFFAGYMFDVSSSYQLAFSVSAALAVAGLILSTMLSPIKKTQG